MNVGIVGLGKLGFPVAAAMASRGLQVYGHDIRNEAMRLPDRTDHEAGLAETIEKGKDNLRFASLANVIRECEVIFVAVETPHDPRFEGVTPLPRDRQDFNYAWLRAAVGNIAVACDEQRVDRTIAVISTVLPGTMDREIRPLLGDRLKLVYTPSFIAMGTTIRDFLDPEFVLLGYDDLAALEEVIAVYGAAGLGGHQFYTTSVQNAELIKVAYNTFIGLKIAFANTLMEVCHKTDCDVDEVTGALKLAHRRLISGAYMDGGMGDGGGCHPRDNIALSWLARELDLSYDLFGAAMECRERQAQWLADLLHQHARRTGLNPVILGVAYKPGSHIITGSPALLVKGLYERSHPHDELVQAWDPHVPGYMAEQPARRSVFLIGCRHPEFPDLKLPEGSVVIDPFRYMPDMSGIEVVRLGQWEPAHIATSASTSQPLAA